MRSMIYLSMLILSLSLNALSVLAQSADEKDVSAAVEVLRKAMIDGDRSALEKVAATELSYGHSSGLIEDKTAFVEALASGKSDFTSIELADQTVRIVGTTAIVRHKLSGTTNNDGKPGTVNIGVLLIWLKQNGSWKLVARQAYKL